MYKKILAFYIAISTCTYMYPQLGTNINVVVPKSPEAAAMEKVNAASVSSYSGAANIGIPIFDLESKNVSMPVSLNYSTTGIRIDQVGSTVGMGWVLNYGGVVTRQIRGLPDAEGVVRSYPPNDCQVQNLALLNYLNEMTQPVLDKDAQPDLFQYQFAGYNGSFYLDSSGNVVELNKTNLKIQLSLSGSVINSRYDCTITTPDGTKYFFTVMEETFSEMIVLGDATYTGTLPQVNYAQTAAYLGSVIHPLNGGFTLSYISRNAETYTGIDQTYERYDPNNNTEYCSMMNGITTSKSKTYYRDMKAIQQISNSTGGKLIFDYEDRKDLIGGRLLKSVSLYNDNIKLKSIGFEYQHVIAQLPGNFFSLLASDSSLLYRSYLKKVRFYTGAGIEINRYEFNYYQPEDLPNRLSFNQDFLGFFNNANNIDCFIPPIGDNSIIASYFPLATANRDPNSLQVLKGSLSSLKYPTGGTDSIVYELHSSTTPGESILTSNLQLSVRTLENETGLSGTSSVVTINSISNQPLKLTVGALVALSGDPANNPDPSINVLYYEVLDITNSTTFMEGYLNYYDKLNTLIYNFAPGHNYQIRLTVLVPDARGTMNLTYATASQASIITKYIPGIRVKKIITTDPVNGKQTIKRYFYSFIESLQESSAAGYILPNYLNSYVKRTLIFIPSPYAQWKLIDCQFYRLRSNSVTNLFANSPNGVFYKSIIESNGENFENGAVEHQYLASGDKPSVKLLGMNFNMLFTGTNTYTSHQSGLEFYTAYYKNVAGSLVKVSDIKKFYSLDSRINTNGYGYEIAKFFEHPIVYSSGYYNMDGYDVRKYELRTRWSHLDSVVEKSYEGGNSLVKSLSYVYDNIVHQLPSKTKTYSSEGKLITQEAKYSSDYTGLTATDTYSAGIKKLLLSNIIAAPVEQIVTVKQGSNPEMFRSAVLDVYTSSLPAPIEKNMIETNTLLNSFTRSSVSAGAFQKDSRYKPQVKFLSYDAYGNLLSQQKEKEVIHTYIWDYLLRYPVAEVTNASAQDVAYSSFEADGKGNWTFSGSMTTHPTAPTGTKAYKLSGGNITKSGLTSGTTYIVTYWKRDSIGTITVNGGTGTSIVTKNGWILLSHEITGIASVTISGTAIIDEVRLYPKSARMTTCTYLPMIGIQSQCDINNRIIFYEYDAMGRLSIVRDDDRNILKKYCYNYYSQPEDCTLSYFYSVAKSGNFTRNNCAAGGTPSVVTYTVPVNTYYSAVSQATADQLAQNDVNANGQAYANANGICTFYNVQQSGNFTRNNCTAGSTGSVVTYSIAAGIYSSSVSQAAANQLAINAVNSNGQAYANSNGTCTSACNTSNCSGTGKKCVNGVCETGVKVYTSSTYDSGTNTYQCVYHYEYSDGSWSSPKLETSLTDCMN